MFGAEGAIIKDIIDPSCVLENNPKNQMIHKPSFGARLKFWFLSFSFTAN